MKQARTTYELILADREEKDDTCPTLVIFHGGGSSLEKAKKRWNFSDEFSRNVHVIYLQSYRHYGSKTYGWLTGDSRTHLELDSCFQEILANVSIDPTRIYLTGISAGASMAIDVGLRGTIPSAQVIAFCPGYPKDVFADGLVIKEAPHIGVIAGEADFYRSRQITLGEALEMNKIPHSYQVLEGVGHVLPMNYEEFILEAMRY